MHDRVQGHGKPRSLSGSLVRWFVVLSASLFALGPVSIVFYGETVPMALPFIVIPIAKVMLLAGAVWALPAALIAYKLAKDEGLSPFRHAVLGAIYSVAFLLPWFYHVFVTILGRPLLSDFARLGYVILYATWLLGPIAGTSGAMFLHTIMYESGGEYILPRMTLPLIVMSLTWIVSLSMLTTGREGPEILSDSPLPSLRHTVPLILAAASVLAYWYLFRFYPAWAAYQ